MACSKGRSDTVTVKYPLSKATLSKLRDQKVIKNHTVSHMGSISDDLVKAAASNGRIQILSRRMVRPMPSPTTANGHTPPPEPEEEDIHLTPWDLRLINVDYIQKGVVLPKPSLAGDSLVGALASSFARALGRYYPFAGRLVADERGDGTVTVRLLCTGEGAEFVHAAALDVSVEDIVGSFYTPPVVWSFYPFNGVLGADAAIESRPVLAVQVTELADGVFIGMSMNHSVGDGTTFWEFFNTWSEISRGGVSDDLREISTPTPAFRRWFMDTSAVPIPLPFGNLEHVVRRRFKRPAMKECFFAFSAASVKKLKARANDEMAGVATAGAISSLQALLAHLWRAASRARRLPPDQETFYTLLVGCRGRVNGIPPGYVGNAVVLGTARATAGEIQDRGLGWTAWQLNRAVVAFDEAAMKEWLRRWMREPYLANMSGLSGGGTALVTGSSPRFDVFGNDFGWGKPVAVRSGAGDKTNGNATVFEGPERGGSMSLEVGVDPESLERLLADEEFMDAVSPPASQR